MYPFVEEGIASVATRSWKGKDFIVVDILDLVLSAGTVAAVSVYRKYCFLRAGLVTLPIFRMVKS